MSRIALIDTLEQTQLKADVPEFHVGDTVSVHVKIVEGNKERTQVFTGTVIARKGTGLSETFSLHRVAYGEGMERVFMLHSPRVVKIEVQKEGDVRRSKLYYLRGTAGKKARVKGRVVSRKKKAAGSAAAAAAATKTATEAETAAANDSEQSNNSPNTEAESSGD